MLLERKKIAMVLAEFLGTAILTSVVLAVSKSNVGIAYFVSLAAGLALAAGMLFFGAASGAHFNPAITIGMWTARRMKTLPALAYIAAQLLGGLAAYQLFSYLVNNTIPASGAYDSRILVAEAVGAFIFSLACAATVYNKFSADKSALLAGAAFVVGLIVASVASVPGVSLLNPAIALGMNTWVWGTYVLGPILGAVIGFNLYALLFAPANSLLAKAGKAEKK
ncbi:MAG TPA: aquaporin [Candidatus Saccharimonadales bacterium]